MVKQKKKKNVFNIFANVLKIKNVNIPLHKYSYPYLGQLEFSSGAFILLVGVTKSEGDLWQIQLNGYDLERHTRLNKR